MAIELGQLPGERTANCHGHRTWPTTRRTHRLIVMAIELGQLPGERTG